MNQLHLETIYDHTPDQICIILNNREIYKGNAFCGKINFEPCSGTNLLKVFLTVKSPGNFIYDNDTQSIKFDSRVIVKEIIVEKRYFRSLLHKFGKTVVDLEKNPNFHCKELPGSTMLTMANQHYEICFDYPVKFWMQKNLHDKDLLELPEIFTTLKSKLK